MKYWLVNQAKQLIVPEFLTFKFLQQKTAAEEAKPALKRINVEEEEPKSNDGYEATQVPNGNNAELKSNRSDLTESSTAWADEKLPTRPLMQTSCK